MTRGSQTPEEEEQQWISADLSKDLSGKSSSSVRRRGGRLVQIRRRRRCDFGFLLTVNGGIELGDDGELPDCKSHEPTGPVAEDATALMRAPRR
ncbi:hypothetical protein MUK42_34072 [Musa troglodytarum]|uniref:Uncharacterized protein n=1 Tax=Musa troglodytarum TaxID=320322 RepID=A0A9E7G599_9LILI|nr:hypothetical protein MUK42_34072 [Musa troglodytarum]